MLIFHCHVSLPECNRFNSRRVLVNLEVYRRSSSSTAKAPWYIPATKINTGHFNLEKLDTCNSVRKNIWSQRSSGAKSWIGLRYTKKCRTLNRSTWGDRCYHKTKKRKQVSKRSNIPHSLIGLPGTLRMPHMHGPILCSWALLLIGINASKRKPEAWADHPKTYRVSDKSGHFSTWSLLEQL